MIQIKQHFLIFTKNNNNRNFENKVWSGFVKLEIFNKNDIFNDLELNELSYSKAVDYDKRSFFNYYLNLIKREHLIIFTFFIKEIIMYILLKYLNLFFLYQFFYLMIQ